MKHYIFSGLIASLVLIGVSAPQPSYALSCMDPSSMLEFYTTNEDYVVFTAMSGEVKEYINEPATTDGDPNFQYDSGYSGQYVDVKEAHKGYLENSLWVYFQKDSTWGYLCSGGPGEIGKEYLYIIENTQGRFELPRVVNIYPADSPLAAEIVAALEVPEADSTPSVEEVSAEDWKNRLRSDIKEMLFIIKIKFSEFQWWLNK